MSDITKDTLVEDLVREHPWSVTFLSRKGIVCVKCGEPVWGTVEEAAQRAGFGDRDIPALISELKEEQQKSH